MDCRNCVGVTSFCSLMSATMPPMIDPLSSLQTHTLLETRTTRPDSKPCWKRLMLASEPILLYDTRRFVHRSLA